MTIASRFGAASRSVRSVIGVPADAGTVELRVPGPPHPTDAGRRAYASCPPYAKRPERVSHRALDGAQYAPPTGCTGSLFFFFDVKDTKNKQQRVAVSPHKEDPETAAMIVAPLR